MGAWLEAELSKIKVRSEHREGLEPSSPHYGCGVLAAGRPVRCSVGPAGLEPAPAWLRARDAAANTLVPSKLKSVGAEGVEPTACVL